MPRPFRPGGAGLNTKIKIHHANTNKISDIQDTNDRPQYRSQDRESHQLANLHDFQTGTDPIPNNTSAGKTRLSHKSNHKYAGPYHTGLYNPEIIELTGTAFYPLFELVKLIDSAATEAFMHLISYFQAIPIVLGSAERFLLWPDQSLFSSKLTLHFYSHMFDLFRAFDMQCGWSFHVLKDSYRSLIECILGKGDSKNSQSGIDYSNLLLREVEQKKEISYMLVQLNTDGDETVLYDPFCTNIGRRFSTSRVALQYIHAFSKLMSKGPTTLEHLLTYYLFEGRYIVDDSSNFLFGPGPRENPEFKCASIMLDGDVSDKHSFRMHVYGDPKNVSIRNTIRFRSESRNLLDHFMRCFMNVNRMSLTVKGFYDGIAHRLCGGDCLHFFAKLSSDSRFTVKHRLM